VVLCVFCEQKIWKQQRISTNKCCPYGLHKKLNKGENIVKWIKGQRMERRSGKRSSGAGSEKMERVGDR
jgi:hypothetical protein